ncbi:MAG: hypothetical protein ABIJ27_07850 [Candidatus Omnitrophota bacterium]
MDNPRTGRALVRYGACMIGAGLLLIALLLFFPVISGVSGVRFFGAVSLALFITGAAVFFFGVFLDDWQKKNM